MYLSQAHRYDIKSLLAPSVHVAMGCVAQKEYLGYYNLPSISYPAYMYFTTRASYNTKEGFHCFTASFEMLDN